MRRLLLILMLAALAISGCTEKGPSAPERSVEELKNLSAPSAENLSSFAVHSLAVQAIELNAGSNASEDKATTITESMETRSSVNLSGMMVHVNGSTESKMEVEGEPENSNEIGAEVYLIGNSTYIQDESGNWTHLIDPRSAEEVWGEDRNNQVLSLARTFNLSELEQMGSESVEGEDAYKALKSVLDGSVAAMSDNVLIYATSNRRHLMPEYHDENLQARHVGGEIHPGEATEEKISLSERFGLWISFYPFSQAEYLDIVAHWLSSFGVPDGELAAVRQEALQWALMRGSRSGRVAWQFARDYAGQRQDGER